MNVSRSGEGRMKLVTPEQLVVRTSVNIEGGGGLRSCRHLSLPREKQGGVFSLPDVSG